MQDGKKVVTNEPLKSVRDDDDVSMAMKLEIFPNRDSTVFLERFGMHDCETFIRGTYRFKGFSPVSHLADALKSICLWLEKFLSHCFIGNLVFP